jgi:hypothetical protein
VPAVALCPFCYERRDVISSMASTSAGQGTELVNPASKLRDKSNLKP